MNIKLAVFSAGLGCALSAGAFAMPLAQPASTAATPARVICNEYGRCWDRPDNPGEAIARGVVRGFEGRSVEPRRDWDGDRGYHRGWDRDRDRRRWHDDDD
jgi:hypothetical protein